MTAQQKKPTNDMEASADSIALGFSQYAEGFGKFLSDPEISTPLTIALDGPWGSGKSTLLKAIARETLKKGNPRVIWIELNAWDHERTGQPALALLGELRLKLAEKLAALEGLDDAQSRLAEYGASVTKAAAGFVVRTAGRALGADPQHTEELANALVPWSRVRETFEKVARSIGEQKKVLLITVDDLDRVREEGIVDLIEVLKLVLQEENCVFLLAGDFKRIERVVEQRYLLKDTGSGRFKSTVGRDYLEKIVQVRFELPTPDTPKLREWLNDKYFQGMDAALKDALLASGLTNPRRIKRVISTYFLNLEILGAQEPSEKGPAATEQQQAAFQHAKAILPVWTVLRTTSPRFVQYIQRNLSDKPTLFMDYRAAALQGGNDDNARHGIWEEFLNETATFELLKLSSLGRLDSDQDIMRAALTILGTTVPPEEIQPDLSGQVLRGRDLTTILYPQVDAVGADFSKATLIGLNGRSGKFLRSNFTDCILNGADLSKASFIGATMTRARLKSALCDGATFMEADLERADFEGASLVGAALTRATVTNATFRHARLSGATFRGIPSSGFTALTLDSILDSQEWRAADFEEDVKRRLEARDARRKHGEDQREALPPTTRSSTPSIQAQMSPGAPVTQETVPP